MGMRWTSRAWWVMVAAALGCVVGAALAPPRAEATAGSPVPPTPPALRYRTFDVRPVAVASDLLPVTPDVLGARLGARLEDRLRGWGLRPAEGDPDVVVVYAAAQRTTSPVERLAGLQPLEGTLTIKLYDPEAKRVVWESSGQAGERDLDKLIDVLLDRTLTTSPPPS
jgi:hypothetical protein